MLYKLCYKGIVLGGKLSLGAEGNLQKAEWPNHPSQVPVFSVVMWDFIREGWLNITTSVFSPIEENFDR